MEKIVSKPPIVPFDRFFQTRFVDFLRREKKQFLYEKITLVIKNIQTNFFVDPLFQSKQTQFFVSTVKLIFGR